MGLISSDFYARHAADLADYWQSMAEDFSESQYQQLTVDDLQELTGLFRDEPEKLTTAEKGAVAILCNFLSLPR